MMTQGESQGTLACSVCLEPVAISGPHQVSALACGHCFGHSCIHTWLERKKRGNGGRCPQCNKKAVTKDIRKLFVPDFRSFVDTEELDEAREALAKERAGRIEAEANQLRISQRLKKLEERLKESEQERDDAIERARSGGGASGSGSGGASGAERRTQDGDASAWGFLQPSVGGDKKRKKESEEPAERRAEGDHPARVRPEQGRDHRARARGGGGDAATGRGGGRAAAQGIHARPLRRSVHRSDSRREVSVLTVSLPYPNAQLPPNYHPITDRSSPHPHTGRSTSTARSSRCPSRSPGAWTERAPR